MITRRAFLAATAVTAVGSLAAAEMQRALANPVQTDPGGVAASNRRAPTQWGNALPGIMTSFAPNGRQIALTLDACDGACDEALLNTLQNNGVPAVLFFSSRWIDRNPDRAAQLAANPLFQIGNHGTRHVPLSVTGRSAYGIAGTRSADEVVDEVWRNHQRLTALTGRPPTWFRPGTAYYDDVAVDIVHQLGEQPLGFTVNGDTGAKASAARVRSNLTSATPGSIVIVHMNHPNSGTHAGIADAVPQMLAAGWQFVTPG
ncbi:MULTISPECIES: polysaccharide deacetylase family protein [unclassified Mycolicibacterium]|uniref:polysaccharide deacetylase family protein n=1 Tax=unclassified Mycolicibacterium TaxID=2636767 RepID=UPI00130B32F4|nr:MULTISPECIES: polysaccharide deacetylase family protein [unclassified Mycolicibacterium]MUL81805.1 polysaccharide deacetylase family protein [Mycolicibacterium sp. CBMA 329]MUL87571.1 polysaccharide deacetylase family protein [Mycolicibacterium sp. CBMA 331]MUL99565.1 polysaccharide deacetylase family protein [Mycolicibacterium sp. CBMA 334]MUM26582.1 polysaccharide deacetylase family protein [Mycolicibacterium sp. CBMA 295]MUM37868.1 polysaccharide deacetylase family protein [Mycolicibacte